MMYKRTGRDHIVNVGQHGEKNLVIQAQIEGANVKGINPILHQIKEGNFPKLGEDIPKHIQESNRT